MEAMTKKARSEIVIRLPEGWSKAAFVGGEYAFLGWFALVAIALVNYVSQSSSPYLEGMKWTRAVWAASDFWRLAHGGSFAFGGGSISLIPLAFPVAMIALLAFAAGREIAGVARGFLALGYVPTVLVLSLLTGGSSTLRIFGGALLIALLASAIALLPRLHPPAQVRAGILFAFKALAIVAGLSVLLLAVALGIHAGGVKGIYALLSGGVVGTITITLLWLSYVPTLACWALSWCLGAGFQAGQGATSSPFSVAHLPIPALPPYGALPTKAPGAAIVLLSALFFALLGFLLARTKRFDSSKNQVDYLLTGGGIFALVMFVWAAFARGSLGDGRMEQVGLNLGSWTLWFLLAALMPLLLGAFFADPTRRSQVSGLVSKKQPVADKQTPTLTVVKDQAQEDGEGEDQAQPARSEGAAGREQGEEQDHPDPAGEPGEAEQSPRGHRQADGDEARAGSTAAPTPKRLRLIAQRQGDPDAPTTAIPKDNK